MKISFVILTFNSQKYLSTVLNSCKFANEVLIIDSGSIDDTLKIANSFTNTKTIHQKWLGFGKQKQIGVEACKNDWVFVLDSDEVITDELKNEILSMSFTCKSYFVPRLNYFFGKPIRYCGLYPDATLRLFDKNYAKFSEDKVHEKVITNEKTSKLKNHMLHFAYEDI